MMISPFRLFFHVFEILIFWAVIGETGKKKNPKMKNNNYIHHAPYQNVKGRNNSFLEKKKVEKVQ